MYIAFKFELFRSGPVAFVSYNNISDILKPTFFKTIINTKKTVMSTVVSVLLSQDTQLTTAVNVTFRHTTTTVSYYYYFFTSY